MTASVPLPQRSVSDQRRAVVWLGVLTLLLSLLTPIVSIQAADATQTRTSQEACDPGFVPNDESGECEPSSPANLQIAQECDEGTVLNQDTGECEPEAPDEPQRVPAECPEGEELNRETGACIPIPSDEPSLVRDCPDGTALNQQTGQCEANVPPAESTDAPMLDEPPPDTGGTITIQKWNCPAGYDVAEAADPLADCTEAAGGVTFTIDDGNLPGPDQVEVTGDDQGAVVFGGLEPGTHTVTEEVPAGIAYATSWCHALNGAPIHLDNPPRLVFEIGDVAHWTCDWLNVPEEDETGSTVTVVKWRCPLGVPEDEDLLAYSGICTQQHNGVDFTLDHAGGSFPGTTENGEIEWTGVPAGDVEVQETVPPGFEDPKVFCLSKPVGGNGPWQQVPADGGLIPLDIPEDGWEIHCEVFNIPGQEASITVHKFNCPGGDFGESLVAHEAGCTDVGNGIEFTLDNSDGSSTQAIAGGSAVWNDVPEGPFTITETIPPGWSEPNWFCGENYIDEETGFVVIGFMGPVDAPDGVRTGSIGHATTEYFCKVYNFPDADTNSLTVHKWLCPAGFDENIDDPETHCTEAMDGVTFTLGDMEATTGDAGPGTAVFVDIPAGDHGLIEVLPGGIARGFNGGCSVNGQPVPLLAVIVTEPPAIWVTFVGEGAHWVCDWYNVPEDEEENSVTIRKWICPTGTGHDESQGWYESNCIQQHDGVEFTVTSAAGIAVQETAGGVVQFDVLPAGEIDIKETIPAGFGEPNVFCGVDNEWMPYDASAPIGGWNHEFPDDGESEELFCYVFNILSENRTVIAHKFLCPERLEPESEDFQDWQDTCTDPAEGVEFTLSDADGDQTEPTSAAGWVPFHNVAQGDVSLTEHTPPGYQDPFVFCSLLAFESNGSIHNDLIGPVEVNGNTVSHTLDYPGFLWSCFFFNIPEEPEENSVTIRKWYCPEGTGYEESQAWYEANCVQQHDGVEFKISSDLGIAVTETAGGAVQFDGLPAGVVGIQETIPAGFGEPIVFCTDNGAWDLYPAPTGHWQHEFSHDGTSEAFVCYVYNIPGERPDVTIHKWTCPEGYDLNAAGADPKVDCTEATNGVEFQFGPSAPAAEAELQTTGDVIDGGVIFDDLEPGTYKVTELVPEGIDHVFVLECTGHIMGVLQPYPLQIGNVLDNIDVDAGEHLVCHWYNVPGTDGEKLSLVKYICSTETFVSDVDCEIYEGGATFDLLRWNAGDGVWEVIDTEVTDGTGMVVWPDVDLGDYRLDELDGEWCHLTTTPVFGPGDGFSIFEGDETVVHVYNCDPDWTTTTIPQKYPNTGVAPAETDSGRRDVAQGALMQIDPTAEPGKQLQANPTEEPDLPIRVSPTQTPTPRVTQEPDSPGGLQANPTEVPSEEPPDSDNDLPLQIEPTQAPAAELPGDAGQIEIGATIYVQADVCDGVGFDPYASTYWWGFIAGCPHPPNGWPVLDFEFIATDGAGFLESSSPGWPADVVVFDVPATTVTISTSVPDGFAEPVSLCIDAAGGYTPILNEPPPGVLLHTTGDSVTLDLDPGQSYACTFYHVTEVPHSNAVTVNTWLCPQGTAQGMVLTEYMDVCADEHNDVDLTLYPYVGGPQAATTVDGVAHWDSVSMGQIILVLDSPSGFGEPVVFCGTTESPGGGIQHPALVPPDNQGNYRGMLEVPGAELVCHWFSIPTGPGGF